MMQWGVLSQTIQTEIFTVRQDREIRAWERDGGRYVCIRRLPLLSPQAAVGGCGLRQYLDRDGVSALALLTAPPELSSSLLLFCLLFSSSLLPPSLFNIQMICKGSQEQFSSTY